MAVQTHIGMGYDVTLQYDGTIHMDKVPVLEVLPEGAGAFVVKTPFDGVTHKMVLAIDHAGVVASGVRFIATVDGDPSADGAGGEGVRSVVWSSEEFGDFDFLAAPGATAVAATLSAERATV